MVINEEIIDMNANEAVEIISRGENLTVEFKQSSIGLNRDLFETVCAFLNHSGGHLFLGVKDNGEIVGINENYIAQIKKDFISAMNNPQKINPTFYLSIEEIKIDNHIILYVYIPESSQVHRCAGTIYDRNEDGDINVTENMSIVSSMYIRKQSSYTENIIYPYVKLEDLRLDVLAKVRKLALNQRVDHPWGQMNDLELLKSAGLYLKDYQSGKEGFTLAAILLIGKDNVILSALPHYKTDAILRRADVDRYDDRDDIRTNLIESYERLMGFISKHLNDKFYLEKDQRISLRDKIFREVISNLLIHREYSSAYPARLIIEKEKVYTENSNKPHGHGVIDPKNFLPYPKNPTIAKFFKEIGWVDELGSGVRNIYKYSKIYSGADPVFIEDSIFKTSVPLNMQISKNADSQLNFNRKIIVYCKKPRSRNDIQKYLGINSRRFVSERIINLLVKNGDLKLTIPDKPRSPYQKYYSEDDS